MFWLEKEREKERERERGSRKNCCWRISDRIGSDRTGLEINRLDAYYYYGAAKKRERGKNVERRREKKNGKNWTGQGSTAYLNLHHSIKYNIHK